MNDATKPEKAATASLDLEMFDTRSGANEGYELEIISPVSGEGSGFFITVLGEDSDTFRRLQQQQQQRRIKRATQRGRLVEITPEDMEEDELSLMVACTKAWRTKNGSEVTFRDEAWPFDAEHVTRLYQEMPEVRRQVREAIRTQANFIKRSAPH